MNIVILLMCCGHGVGPSLQVPSNTKDYKCVLFAWFKTGIPVLLCPTQDIEDVARSVVEQAAMAVDTAYRESAAWKEKAQAQANRVSQMEQKVNGVFYYFLGPL